MATSTVAIGKLSVAKRLGLPLPNGWAFDRSGNPTNDADTGRAIVGSRPLVAVGYPVAKVYGMG